MWTPNSGMPLKNPLLLSCWRCYGGEKIIHRGPIRASLCHHISVVIMKGRVQFGKYLTFFRLSRFKTFRSSSCSLPAWIVNELTSLTRRASLRNPNSFFIRKYCHSQLLFLHISFCSALNSTGNDKLRALTQLEKRRFIIWAQIIVSINMLN